MTTGREGFQNPDGREALGRLKDKFRSINLERKLMGQNTRMRASFVPTSGNIEDVEKNVANNQVRFFLAELRVDQILKAVRDEQWRVGDIEEFEFEKIKGLRLTHSFDDVKSSTARYTTPNYRRIHSPYPPIIADFIDGPLEHSYTSTRESMGREKLELRIRVYRRTYKDVRGNWDFSFLLDIVESYPKTYHSREFILVDAQQTRQEIMPYNASLMDNAFDFLVDNIMKFVTISPQALEKEAGKRVADFKRRNPGK